MAAWICVPDFFDQFLLQCLGVAYIAACAAGSAVPVTGVAVFQYRPGCKYHGDQYNCPY